MCFRQQVSENLLNSLNQGGWRLVSHSMEFTLNSNLVDVIRPWRVFVKLQFNIA
jgi:hypothetical protein